ncbi:MAG: tetratricopeptide repeat protein [Bacteroidota bacterium]|nr:tetratricopeptide repeat protein [Bacteroidota bacterium]
MGAITRNRLFLIGPLLAILLMAAGGCGSNPNVEGAKLDLRNKDYARALENVNKALESEPDNPEALFLKGDVLSEMLPDVLDKRERADYIYAMVGAYRRGLELDPAWPTQVTRRLYGVYLTEFNSGIDTYNQAEQLPGQARVDAFAEAARHFRSATVIFPDSGDAYLNEAAAYFGAGLMGDAIDAYESALSVGLTDREIYIYLAKTYELLAEDWAEDDDRSDHYRKMAATLELGLDQHPDDRELRAMLLNAYVFADQAGQALNFYARELSSEGENKVFLYNYGTLMLQEADYDGAIAMLSRAVSLDSAYVNARFNLGAAYINKAVDIDADYRAVDDSITTQRGQLPAFRISRMEARMRELQQHRRGLFEDAIEHLEMARMLIERQQNLGEVTDVCRALYRAYAQINEGERAEALTQCATSQSGP